MALERWSKGTPNAWIWPVALLAALLLLGCTKEGEAEAIDNDPQAVVEAYLYPGGTVSLLVTRERPFQEEDPENGIAGLLVTMEHNGTIDTLADSGGGQYTGTSATVIIPSDTYTLHFDYNGHAVSGTTTIPIAPAGFSLSSTSLEIPVIDMGNGPPTGGLTFPDPIEVDWENPDAAYHLVVVECIEADPEQIADSDAPVRPRFRTEPTTNSQAQLSFRDFTYFGTHRVILYRLNADYAALYLDNGANSQNLSTPQTNIVNGLGIFTGVNTDTLFLEVQEQ